MKSINAKIVLSYIMTVVVIVMAAALAYFMLEPAISTWIKTADDNGEYLSGKVFTEKDLEVNLMPDKMYYDRWEVLDGYDGDFVYEDYVFEHGIGLYVPSRTIDDGDVGVVQLGLHLGGMYDQMYFKLCTDSLWTAYEDSGLFKLMCYVDGAVVYNSEFNDYTYAEDVYLDIQGAENIVFELHEIEGPSGTLNVILGDIEVNILDE